ncbi:MAG: helix-turn-helix transcriptional regulator [Candidatus Aminicenantes bacterium]|nr:helix-turn-helix transcriptional regulator [Candidatus Aminicenantes bacterium]
MNQSPETRDIREWLSQYPGYKEQVKGIRESLGLTQEQLAKMVDRTPRAIRTIENGEAFPRISTLQSIAEALNADLNIFLVPRQGIPPVQNKKSKPKDNREEIIFPLEDKNDICFGETD